MVFTPPHETQLLQLWSMPHSCTKLSRLRLMQMLSHVHRDLQAVASAAVAPTCELAPQRDVGQREAVADQVGAQRQEGVHRRRCFRQTGARRQPRQEGQPLVHLCQQRVLLVM